MMGADIHGVIQQRINNGAWRTHLEIDDTRNYLLFSILGGVRNYSNVTPITEDRGFPEDFAIEDEDLHPWHFASGGDSVWMGDHSFTWMTVEEIEAWPRWDDIYAEGFTYRERCGTFWAWLEYAKTKTYGDELRIVIGFDS